MRRIDRVCGREGIDRRLRRFNWWLVLLTLAAAISTCDQNQLGAAPISDVGSPPLWGRASEGAAEAVQLIRSARAFLKA
jgi:hypothetical protein